MKRAKQKIRPRSNARLDLQVEFATELTGWPDATLLRRWAAAALLPGSPAAEIGLRVVGEEEGRRLNHDYRGKDYATNVLTFALNEGEDPLPGMPLIGDIVLAAPVVEREAQEQGKSLAAHCAHLVVHSVLHLQGYDHLEEQEALVMEALETVMVKQLGYPDPYGEEHA